MLEYKVIAAQSTTSLSEATKDFNKELDAETKAGWIPSGDPQLSVVGNNSANTNRQNRFCILQRLERVSMDPPIDGEEE